jgi:hypothetical protein
MLATTMAMAEKRPMSLFNWLAADMDIQSLQVDMKTREDDRTRIRKWC